MTCIDIEKTPEEQQREDELHRRKIAKYMEGCGLNDNRAPIISSKEMERGACDGGIADISR